jgi:hypothetical protein
MRSIENQKPSLTPRSHLANDPLAHITKWDVAECIWRLMAAAHQNEVSVDASDDAKSLTD